MNGVTWALHRGAGYIVRGKHAGAFSIDECGECPECLITRAQGRHK